MEEKIVKLKQEFKEKGLRGLALDIDETLSDSNIHWFEHMCRFHTPKGETPESMMKKFRFVEEVKEWQTKEAMDQADKYIHSHEFNETIPLIENADLIVEKLNKKIPVIAYITARPKSVRLATLNWLRKHNFPEAELIMQEDSKASEEHLVLRNNWKASVLKYLYPEILGIVDNDVMLAEGLEKIDYEGIHFLYGPQIKEFKGQNGVIVCPTWESVLTAVENLKGLK